MSFFRCTGLLLCFSLSFAASAEEVLEEEKGIIALAKVDVEFDWVRLKSREWIKGELKGFYEDKLEFDSDVLDLLSIDEEDIHSIISSRPHSIKLRDGSIIRAPIEIINRRGSILGKPDAYTFFEVLTIAGEKETGIDIWDIKVDLGVSLSKGNTDQTEWNGRVNAKRRTVSSRLIVDFFATRSTADGQEVENNGSLSSTYDIFYTEKIFFRPALVTISKDPFKNIETEYTYGAGIGYYFIDTNKTEWDASVGPSYRKTNFVSNTELGHSSEESLGGFFETNFETELSKTVDFEASYTLNIAEKASGGMRHELFTTLEFDLFEDVDLDVSFIWDRTSDPQANENGIVPKKDDYKMYISVGIEL